MRRLRCKLRGHPGFISWNGVPTHCVSCQSAPDAPMLTDDQMRGLVVAVVAVVAVFVSVLRIATA